MSKDGKREPLLDPVAFAEGQAAHYAEQAEQAAPGSAQRLRWEHVAQEWRQAAADARADRAEIER